MTTQCGFIAIAGRPNVGKSTLMNRILGQKISITSRRPQTTRHNITGIHTEENRQFVFVDTPGLHLNADRAMNQYMNRSAKQAIKDVDVVLFLLEGTRWTKEDEAVARRVGYSDAKKVLVINKEDKVTDKGSLLPFIETVSEKVTVDEVFIVSAKQGKGIDKLLEKVGNMLPEGPFFYDEDQVTDRSMKFMAAEIVREKLMRNLGQELPYYMTVEIEQFKETEKLIEIAALIWVEKKGQKKIVIGEKGAKIKDIGTQARKDLERLFDKKVFLQTWVRVREGWSDDIRALQSLGYKDE